MSDGLPLQQALETRTIVMINTRIKATAEGPIIVARRLNTDNASASLMFSVEAEIQKINQSIYARQQEIHLSIIKHYTYFLSD